MDILNIQEKHKKIPNSFESGNKGTDKNLSPSIYIIPHKSNMYEMPDHDYGETDIDDSDMSGPNDPYGLDR